jgi:hypothetical protein
VPARLVSETTVTLPVPQGFVNVIVAACPGDGCGPYSGARGINPAGPNLSFPNLGTLLAASVANGPGVEFARNRIPGDDDTNTWYRLYVQDLSRLAAVLDVYTRDNFHAASLKAEGARRTRAPFRPATSSSAGVLCPAPRSTTNGWRSWAGGLRPSRG